MRLISFLGTGKYAETQYTLNGRQCRTRYIAAALGALLQAEEVVILATKEAESCHWKDLQQELQRLSVPAAALRRIPSGGVREELWEQFDVIRLAMTEGEPGNVSFDITHGYRAQPFFAAAVINHLRATRENPPDILAYYGEFHADAPHSPIWDISAFIDLLNWSNALQSLIKTGHGGAVAALARIENARLQKSVMEMRPKKLKSLADTLHDFTANLATVRCKNIVTGDEHCRGSIRRVLKSIDDSEREVNAYFKPLAPVLTALKTKLQAIASPGLFGADGLEAMAALARLYLEFERYPEAAIVIREGWISSYAGADKPEEELLARGERLSTERRWRQCENQGKPHGPADALSRIRNDIQHGGFNPSPMPADALIRDVKKFAEDFSGKPVQRSATADECEGKVYFVSRHPGARDWAAEQGLAVDIVIDHLEVSRVRSGDVVIGSLPVSLAAAVCALNARYLHLTLDLPSELRGKELTASEMRRFGARVEEFRIERAV